MTDADLTRLNIVSTALLQALAGAHYLNGSVGNTPGNTDGHKPRKLGAPKDGSWDLLAVRAASWGGYRCRGRYETVGGYLFQKPKDPSDPAEKLNKLRKYVDDCNAKGLPLDAWSAFDNSGLYPRRLQGKGSAIYLGESCTGKRHFDCISFVNWVIGQTLKKNPTYSIDNYKAGIAPVEVFSALPVTKLKNADIAVRSAGSPQHIGILTEDGKLIHASGAATGVVVGEYQSSKWDAVCRLKESYLK